MSRLLYEPGPTPLTVEGVIEYLGREMRRIANAISGTEQSATWDPGSIANGAEASVDVSLVGAELGDIAVASFSLDVQDLVISAAVTAQNVVTVTLANNTGGAIDLASGTVKVKLV